MKWIYNIPAAIYQLHNGKSVSISSWFSKNHYSFCQSPLTISISFCHWFTHLCTHTDTHTHTCIHISTARCLVLRVLLPVTKSLVSDITHKSLLINSSPGTKLAFGHGRCSCSFFTAGQVRRLLMAASLPFLFCSLSLSFCFFTLVFSLSHTSHTTSLHHIYPACSAMFCRHQSFSQRQSSEQAWVVNQNRRQSAGIRAWRLVFSLVSSLIHSQGLDHHTHI